MQPVISKTGEVFADIPLAELSKGKVGEIVRQGESLMSPWRAFLIEHSGERELQTMSRLTHASDEKVGEDVGSKEPYIVAVLAAFVLSEIKKGFLIAFILLIPFFVIDLVVGNILVALGLTMMSPSTVSLPLKLLLFVSSDGWLLLSKSLISAYR